jgi:hypothetical protein
VNRNRSLPACNAVPQPNVPPSAPEKINTVTNILGISKILGAAVGLCAVAPKIISSLNTGMASSKPAGTSTLHVVLYRYFERAGTLHHIQNSLPIT